MQRRLTAIVCLIVAGLALSGCTKCGWIWQDGQRACRADVAPR